MYITFLLTLLLTYNIINVITDIKYRKTKNIGHLLFLILGIAVTIQHSERSLLDLGLVVFFALVGGLLLEAFRYSSPGDTKMLIVNSVWLFSISDMSPYMIASGLLGFHLAYFIIASLFVLLKKLGLKGAIQDQKYQIIAYLSKGLKPSNMTVIASFPGAVSIALGVLTYFLILYARGEITHI